MRLFELLQHQKAALPAAWTGNDFVVFLNRFLQDYLHEIDAIDEACALGQRVRAHLPRMTSVARWLAGAVTHYLDNEPDRTYADVVRAVELVLPEVTNLFSQAHLPVGQLYRTTRCRGAVLPRHRLFHTSIFDRQYVGSHRYGIAGFPCLYLAGSLNVCLNECRISQPDWHDAAFARFACRREIQVLDFGYRPGFVGRLAQGRVGQPANDRLDDFIVRYSIAWPLVAACSIINRFDQKFAVEYIISNAIVQWLMRESKVDGVRFFSTRVIPANAAEGDPFYVSYAFPAVKHQGHHNGYSQKLLNLFEVSDVVNWRATTGGANMPQEYQDTQAALDAAVTTVFVP